MPSRQYVIDKPLFKKSYGISPKSSPDHRQYARIRHSTGASPDIALHDGSDSQSPVIAVAYIMKTQLGFKIGLGDPKDAHAMIWEDMKYANKLRTNFAWSMELPFRRDSISTNNTNDEEHARRPDLMWKKTRSVAVDEGSIHAMSTRNWKLVDQDENILAVFTSNISRGQAGTLQVNVDFGKEFDTMILMTLLALYERSRRQ
ncbi:hypothetical protein VFPPC_14898 [Pochonia chlamydosporia 170]|uniref:Uncharacterized protein n=1 Tax=Pochonia chlamydosporia 170 TaxID=1380566 RepID=A0A179EZA2_METCM|nr:hypothetical protein VFPPC_14898 [Pochonia chlamydosporia 170]OAQ58525.1 hypothetical protein VFPPC_14898 [Pochonia chlamydosporia 170]